MYDRAGLGHWRNIRAPNGVVQRLQQTDIGPNPKTGRTIDIAAVAAEHFGYSPKTFPTDGEFSWSAIVDAPASDGILRRQTHTFDAATQHVQQLLGFSEQESDGYFGDATQAAVEHFQRRHGLDVDGEVGPDTLAKLETGDTTPKPVPQSVDIAKLIAEIWAAIQPLLEQSSVTPEPQSSTVLATPTVVVPVKAAWWSKINWAAIGSSAASLVTTNALGLDATTQAQVLLAVNLVTNVATVLLRTFANGSVTPSSIPKK